MLIDIYNHLGRNWGNIFTEFWNVWFKKVFAENYAENYARRIKDN